MGDETASGDAIVALAHCPCGHGIPVHDDEGCPGALATFCMCRLTPSAALDAAIERVRKTSTRHGRFASRRRGAVRSLPGITLDVEKLRSELESDDYERVGPVRPLDPATLIALLAPRLIRPQ